MSKAGHVIKSLVAATVLAALAHIVSADAVISKGVAVADTRPQLAAVRKLLVDPQATPETAALFYNLKQLARRGQTLIGQQDPEQSVKEPGGEMAIKRTAGSDPAVWGSDFMQITCAANTNATGWYRNTEKKIIGLASA
ncbi:MAG: beta-mannosidase, partial [bacterium]